MNSAKTKRPIHSFKNGADAKLYMWSDDAEREVIKDHLRRPAPVSVFLQNGLTVVDVEKPGLGLQEVVDAVDSFPDTFTVRSGGGGLHLYLRVPGFTKQTSFDCGGVHVVDVKASMKGYSLVPPSPHPSGDRYEVERDVEIAEVDEEFFRLVLSPLGMETLEERRRVEALSRGQRRVRALRRRRRERERTTGSNGDLPEPGDVEDAMPGIDMFFGGEQGRNASHPVHGSDTGQNFRVDEGGETARCWRHSRTGGKLYWYGVLEGVISCGDPAPMGEEFVEQVWKPASAEFMGIEVEGSR